MAIGLTSSRGDRRRRVLTEEIKTASKQASMPAHRVHVDEGPRYTSGAAPENHPQVTDFVPRRLRSLAVCMLFGAALIAGLLALSQYADAWALALGSQSVAALRVTGTETLAAWFSSALLTVASLLSILIYSLRKHRIDDYRGRYKVWLWAAFGWLVLSIDHVAPLHQLFVALMTDLTGWTALDGGAAWWIGGGATAFVLFGIRALRDLSESRVALAAALLAIASGSAAVATHLAWLQTASDATAVLVIAGATLGSYLLLVTALAAYARHVILDAQGLLPVKSAHRGQDRDENDSDSPAQRRRKPDRETLDPAREKPKGSARSRHTDLASEPLASKAKATDWVDGSQAEDDPYDDPPSGKRKISKAERKRLRKLKARQQR